MRIGLRFFFFLRWISRNERMIRIFENIFQSRKREREKERKKDRLEISLDGFLGMECDRGRFNNVAVDRLDIKKI